MKTTRLEIEGMTCLNCVTHVQKALEAVPGVRDVDVSVGEGATVRHEESVQSDALLRAVRAAGDYDGKVLP